MSRSALAQAAVAQLRAPPNEGGLALPERQCGLAPDGGRPPPACGELYVGVYAGGRTNRAPAAGLDETYTLAVVLTLRAKRVPYDRLGEKLVVPEGGLDDWSDRIRLCLGSDFHDFRVSARANALIGFDTADADSPRGFAEGLKFLGDEDPVPVGAEWFHGTPADAAGVVQRLRFGGARRVQSFFEGVAT